MNKVNMEKLSIYRTALNRSKTMKVVNMCQLLQNLKGKTATQLLKDYGMDSCMPINLDELVEKIGIKVYEVNFASKITSFDDEGTTNKEKEKILSDILGMLVTVGDSIVVFLKEGLKQHGRRFTIAHEIAHCCLNDGDINDVHVEFRHALFSSDSKNKKEIAANIFAGELLMPENLVRKYCADFVVPEIKAVANAFKVSVPVASERLNYLGITYINMEEETTDCN